MIDFDAGTHTVRVWCGTQMVRSFVIDSFAMPESPAYAKELSDALIEARTWVDIMIGRIEVANKLWSQFDD